MVDEFLAARFCLKYSFKLKYYNFYLTFRCLFALTPPAGGSR